MSREIEIAVEVRLKTEKAIQVFDGKTTVWIPLSQISDQSEDRDGNITSIFLPEWLACERGLI